MSDSRSKRLRLNSRRPGTRIELALATRWIPEERTHSLVELARGDDEDVDSREIRVSFESKFRSRSSRRVSEDGSDRVDTWPKEEGQSTLRDQTKRSTHDESDEDLDSEESPPRDKRRRVGLLDSNHRNESSSDVSPRRQLPEQHCDDAESSGELLESERPGLRE